MRGAAPQGTDMRTVKTLGLFGTGVIGGGWAARALHFGIDVIAADVKPEMEAWIRGAIDNAEPALARLTSAPLPAKGKLSFTTDLRVMAERADFIQENIPEQLELKQRMLAQVSRHAGADVIIASSTSGLTPSDLQRDMVAPERFLVAHPFNPVYLLPLVELVGGSRTAPSTIEAAARFFKYIGMHALPVRREVPGHLTDRLQEALWREILHMVNDGVATTGELDESIIYGPGLRWAAMGTNMIYHLAGGESGMIAPDPDHPNLIYGEKVDKLDTRTGQSRNVDPTLAYPDIHHRSAWTLPLAFSRRGQRALYFADQRLYHLRPGREPRPITEEPAAARSGRYADLRAELSDVPGGVRLDFFRGVNGLFRVRPALAFLVDLGDVQLDFKIGGRTVQQGAKL